MPVKAAPTTLAQRRAAGVEPSAGERVEANLARNSVGHGCGQAASPPPVLVIACGALAKELHAIRQANGWAQLHIRCIDARLHHRPALIPGRLRQEIDRARLRYRRIFVAYADCGTYGGIDRILAAEPDVERLPGLHCYEFFAGAREFRRLSEEEPGTFYLTDFLARFFDRFVMGALMLDRHPELMASFFGNYRRVVYLSQIRDEGLLKRARQAAGTLKLEFHHVHCGYGALETSLAAFARGERPTSDRAMPEPGEKTMAGRALDPSGNLPADGRSDTPGRILCRPVA